MRITVTRDISQQKITIRSVRVIPIPIFAHSSSANPVPPSSFRIMSAPTAAAIAHTKRVCTLYKKALRNLEAWYDRRYIYRYHATILRARFDQHKNERDPALIAQLVADGEREVFEKQHFQPKKFPMSPGGVAFEREVIPPDWVLDYWHPLEKAHYPEYFARREKRKEEYVAFWEKQYGKATATDPHHH